ncbi:hypothetical protein P8605_30210 [Streptomyces sp. T-3]|nr:hypothetical protein [Streptomyces sp. T-3]
MSTWSDLDRYLHLFTRPVLSFTDADGFPFSLRVQPRQDRETGLMVPQLPEGTPAVEGPAWLLWHSHDEDLAGLQLLSVKGDLVRHGEGWAFKPESVLPGPGLGPDGWEGIPEAMERETARYLKKRGITAPESIQWDRLEEIARSVLKEKEQSGTQGA